MNTERARILICAFLIFAVMVSAIAAVYARHEARKMFVELQELRSERDRLEVEWGQLRLEQSTWSSHARVERLARERMGMKSPDPLETRTVQP